jgi:hypothetical protein
VLVLVQPLPRPFLDPRHHCVGWSSSPPAAVSLQALSTSSACQCDPISTVIVPRPNRSSNNSLVVVVAVPTEIDLI